MVQASRGGNQSRFIKLREYDKSWILENDQTKIRSGNFFHKLVNFFIIKKI